MSATAERRPFNHARGAVSAAVSAVVPGAVPAAAAPPPCRAPRPRARLWELNGSIHCSVVGTCLTTAELRGLMNKVLGRAEAERASDHDLHARAVGACGTPSPSARLLAKALDKRHAGVVNRFARLSGEEAVMALWAEFRRSGDIPGAYWAVLTHPDTGYAGMRRAFGDVHMLSHLVGAANRADIKRLCALEEENARLHRKAERQQERLRQAALVPAAPPPAAPAPAAAAPDRGGPDAGLASLTRQLDEARTRLAAEAARRERAEQRLAATRAGREAAEHRATAAEAEAASLRREAAELRREVEALRPDGGGETAAVGDALPPERVLYVGGRPGTLDQARALLLEAGGELLLHDGGRHDNASLLPGLIGRADRVVFPVDCVSHDAALAVKRLCRLNNKPWAPLRSAGLSSFLACMAVPARSAAADPSLPHPECCP